MAIRIGFFLLNSQEEHDLFVGVPVLGTAGDDFIRLFSDNPFFGKTPMPQAYGYGGNDTFYGTLPHVYGGAGDDLFYGGGNAYAYQDPHKSLAYGGAGHDTFIDFPGDSYFYGGAGPDLYTNMYAGTTHSYSGDHDEVDLGDGADLATVYFLNYSYGLEDRSYVLKGGRGVDILNVVCGGIDTALDLGPSKVLDLSLATTGTLLLDRAEVSGFEIFTMSLMTVAGGGRILGTARGDTLELQGTVYAANLANRDDVRPEECDTLTLEGRGGDDLLLGSDSLTSDHLFGGTGRDTLFSGGGDLPLDKLFGGRGDDILIAGRGYILSRVNDEMTGGAGADDFVIWGPRWDIGHTRVRDFHHGIDKLVFDFGFDWRGTDIHQRSEYKAQEHPVSGLYVIEKNADEISFALKPPDRIGLLRETVQMRYDQHLGQFSERFNDNETWVTFLTLTGAPHLTLDDLLYFG